MFNLVIGGVCETNAMDRHCPADLSQGRMPQSSAGHFQTLPGRMRLPQDFYSSRHTPDSKFGASANHKMLIRLRFFTSKAVIDVSNHKLAWIRTLRADQCVQQCHRITAARHGDDQFSTRRHTTAVDQRVGDESRDVIPSRLEMILMIGRAHLASNPAKKLARPIISPLGFKNVGAVFC